MEPKISKSKIDQAGKIIRLHQDDAEYKQAVATINRWRERHILSMDFYFDACSDIAKISEYKGTMTAERLKRLPTIIDKLDRFPHMRLSDMQDIGGVRVILKDVPHLVSFEEKIRKLPVLKSSKDYLAEPKNSGYRGRHLIFKHDGVLTEIQLRTGLQHLWATSVETIDVISNTSLKTSRQSNSYWQEFFELASSAFAYMENLPMLPQHRDWDVITLRDNLTNLMVKYDIKQKLATYAATSTAFDERLLNRAAHYAVVSLDYVHAGTVTTYFPEDEAWAAIAEYEKRERDWGENNNVLVSVNSLKHLREAYPNYFNDITTFTKMLQLMLDFKA